MLKIQLVQPDVKTILEDEFDHSFYAFPVAQQSGTHTMIITSMEDLPLSWTPDMAGEYRLRTFMISGFVNPQVLTVAADNTAKVEA